MMTQNKEPSLAEIAGYKPAFPSTRWERVGDVTKGFSLDGMTMRQYYAAHCPFTLDQAMATLREEIKGTNKTFTGEDMVACLVKYRFIYADLMIAEDLK
jgi:hypothetical protein